MFEFNEFQIRELKIVASSTAFVRRARQPSVGDPRYLGTIRLEGRVSDPRPRLDQDIDEGFSRAHGVKCELLILVPSDEHIPTGYVQYHRYEVIDGRAYPELYQVGLHITKDEFTSLNSFLALVAGGDLIGTVRSSSDQERPPIDDIVYERTGPSIEALADMEKPYCEIDMFEFQVRAHPADVFDGEAVPDADPTAADKDTPPSFDERRGMNALLGKLLRR